MTDTAKAAEIQPTYSLPDTQAIARIRTAIVSDENSMTTICKQLRMESEYEKLRKDLQDLAPQQRLIDEKKDIINFSQNKTDERIPKDEKKASIISNAVAITSGVLVAIKGIKRWGTGRGMMMAVGTAMVAKVVSAFTAMSFLSRTRKNTDQQKEKTLADSHKMNLSLEVKSREIIEPFVAEMGARMAQEQKTLKDIDGEPVLVPDAQAIEQPSNLAARYATAPAASKTASVEQSAQFSPAR